MDDTIGRVPNDLTVPDDASMDYRMQVERHNRFLAQVRRHMKKLNAEVERLGNIRSDGFVHNGPNGIIIGE